MWMKTSHSESLRPASSTSTRFAGSAESRLPSALPAEPPPTMTKSYWEAVMGAGIPQSTRLRSDGHHHAAVLDGHRISARAHARVGQRAARRDLELPAMPLAAQDLPLAPVDEVAAGRRQHGPGDPAGAQLATLVRAAVVERVEAAVDVEDADAAPGDLDDAALARRQLGRCADLSARRHRPPPPHAPAARRGRARSRPSPARATPPAAARARGRRSPSADSPMRT